MRRWVIYTLEDPRGGGVRYVGVTHQRPSTRLNGHIYRAKKDARFHLTAWIQKLLADGVTPVLTVIHEGVGDAWGSIESWWIQWHRERGCDLTNATDGGEGCPGHTVSAAAREKISAARRGKPLSPEHRAKVAAGNRGKKMSPEAIAKTAAFWTGRKHTPEAKAKIAAARRGKPGAKPSAEVVARRAESIRAAYAARKAAGLIKPVSDETRAKISKAGKGQKKSVETRAKMSSAAKAHHAAKRGD